MPVNRCRRDDRPGFRWGDEGTCYTYEPGDKTGRERARMRAARQGRAVKASESLTNDDLLRELRQRLEALEEPGDDGHLWVEDLTSDDEVIYTIRNRDGEPQTFSRPYSIGEDEEVTLGDDRTPVKRRTRWEPAEALEEVYAEGWSFAEATVDRKSGLIRDVSLLGRVSKNGYTYSRRAMREAAKLQKGARIFLDHPTEREEEDTGGVRSVRDMAGRIVAAREARDRVKGDVQVLKGTPPGETLLALAEQMPDAVGFSHRCDGIMSVDDDGRRTVESVTKVFGNDVVTEPATVSGLFEGFRPRRDPGPTRRTEMKLDDLTLEELREARPDLVEDLQEQDEHARKLAEQEAELKRLREYKKRREAEDAAEARAERIAEKLKDAKLPPEIRQDEDVRAGLMECEDEAAEDRYIGNLVKTFDLVERATGGKYKGPKLEERDHDRDDLEREKRGEVDGEALEEAYGQLWS